MSDYESVYVKVMGGSLQKIDRILATTSTGAPGEKISAMAQADVTSTMEICTRVTG